MQHEVLIYSISNYFLSIKRYFSNEHYKFTDVSNENELELFLEKKNIDLAILNLSDDKLLLRISELIRSRTQNSDVPLLYISKFKICLKNIFQGYEKSAILCVQKPFSPENLINSVNLLLNLKKQTVELKQSIIDIRENKKIIEEQRLKLINSAKLSSLGEMAGKIAHEINNPLTIILSSINLQKKARTRGKLNNEILEDIENDIESTVARITKIISGLRKISRETGGSIKEATLIKDIFDDVLGLCNEKLKNNEVNVHIDLEDSRFSREIFIDRVHVSQVFMNLLGNAYDAIEGSFEKWIKIDVDEDEKFYIFKFIDSGGGVAKDIQDKIFNPFYTSKGIGKGTGLGLSISRFIVINNGGSLYLDENHENTCFVVKLPKVIDETLEEVKDAI